MIHRVGTRIARFRGRRSGSAVVVAIVALVFAVGGTAVAGVATISVLTKQEKKQVKKIANKQIDKKASGLSVNHAKSADSATSATSATSANSLSTQFWAVVVGTTGTLVRASPGVIGSDRQSTGIYHVEFNRDVSGCAYQGTLGGNDHDATAVGEISVNPVLFNPAKVFVSTTNISGLAQDFGSFEVLVTC